MADSTSLFLFIISVFSSLIIWCFISGYWNMFIVTSEIYCFKIKKNKLFMQKILVTSPRLWNKIFSQLIKIELCYIISYYIRMLEKYISEYLWIIFLSLSLQLSSLSKPPKVSSFLLLHKTNKQIFRYLWYRA